MYLTNYSASVGTAVNSMKFLCVEMELVVLPPPGKLNQTMLRSFMTYSEVGMYTVKMVNILSS